MSKRNRTRTGRKFPGGYDLPGLLRSLSRDIHKGMPPGGPQGTPKGKAGYTRKVKHRKRRDADDG